MGNRFKIIFGINTFWLVRTPNIKFSTDLVPNQLYYIVDDNLNEDKELYILIPWWILLPGGYLCTYTSNLGQNIYGVLKFNASIYT